MIAFQKLENLEKKTYSFIAQTTYSRDFLIWS